MVERSARRRLRLRTYGAMGSSFALLGSVLLRGCKRTAEQWVCYEGHVPSVKRVCEQVSNKEELDARRDVLFA